MRGFSLRPACLIVSVVFTATLVRPLGGLAEQQVPGLHEQQHTPPYALYMAADALLARPVLLAMTLVGCGIYVVSLPFSLLGGNTVEAANYLVAGPARATFTRCLGCTGVADPAP